MNQGTAEHEVHDLRARVAELERLHGAQEQELLAACMHRTRRLIRLVEDLVLVAVSDAQRKAAEAQQAQMGQITGGMDLPFQLPF